jgi:PhnB protein
MLNFGAAVAPSLTFCAWPAGLSCGDFASGGADMPVKPIPDGYPAVIPYLMVADAEKFIDFMQTVFGAKLVEQIRRPDGGIGHSELRIGDSMIMLSQATEQNPATPVMLHFYVADVDKVFESALAAGAVQISAPTRQFYGDRSAGVREPGGNRVWIATHVEDVAPDELQKRAAEQYRKQDKPGSA